MGVPNTTTFSLRAVKPYVVGNSLREFFAAASSQYFDSSYSGAKDRLTNFRNYQNVQLAVNVGDYAHGGYVITSQLFGVNTIATIVLGISGPCTWNYLNSLVNSGTYTINGYNDWQIIAKGSQTAMRNLFSIGCPGLYYNGRYWTNYTSMYEAYFESFAYSGMPDEGWIYKTDTANGYVERTIVL